MCVQLLGFSDLVTGAIGICTSVGAAIGFLVGGGAGDFFAIRYPNAARPAINQISMVLAAPLYIAFLKGLPGQPPVTSFLSQYCTTIRTTIRDRRHHTVSGCAAYCFGHSTCMCMPHYTDDCILSPVILC